MGFLLWFVSTWCLAYDGSFLVFAKSTRAGCLLKMTEVVFNKHPMRVGENEEVQQQPVVLYLSIPEVCKQAQVWQSCIPGVFRACLPICAYLLPYLLLR